MTRRNYHETFHESTRASDKKDMEYVNFIAYLRHQAEVFFSSIMVHRAVPLLFDTHMSNNINMQLIGFKKDILKKTY